MATFNHPVGVGPRDGSGFQRVIVRVDTRNTYTVMPAPLLTMLGVEPEWTSEFELADESREERRPGGGQGKDRRAGPYHHLRLRPAGKRASPGGLHSGWLGPGGRLGRQKASAQALVSGLIFNYSVHPPTSRRNFRLSRPIPSDMHQAADHCALRYNGRRITQPISSQRRSTRISRVSNDVQSRLKPSQLPGA